MKKPFFVILFCLFHFISGAQWNCFFGLSPGTAVGGQYLTTTVSGYSLYNGMGSAPCNPNDVSLTNTSTGYTITASALNVVNDSIYIDWNIPVSAPSGTYNINAVLY